MDFNTIPTGDNVPLEVNAIIEIPAQSVPVKYEADKQYGLLKVDRIMSAGMRYPANYGFIPQTLARDGDPLDILVIAPFALERLSMISCRPVGLLNMTDQAGPDEKVIAVPVDNVCPATRKIVELGDVDEYVVNQIQFFFENYKKLEPGKWVRFEGWADVDAAYDAIRSAAAAFRNAHHS
ncbi:inorganic diphosphatase [Paraburkholderia lycopersici]|uniref:Inorganic pyrophosphatase n=1 Tax=Paraburkholderia lycopersici TaxID=416944 RepID=A0A1G6QNA9_9BURK|nr:inorganic diphosphatase [Paraburkholderia lycopersici]SDC93890.1 inorganic pyrophosphatase [Paraburkholderia lycopersici]